jgi:predicted thioesterase
MSLIGKTAEVRLRVLPLHTAEDPAFSPEEGFPAVLANGGLANSRLIALIELSASRLLQPVLAAEQASVSVEMHVSHLVPTTQGDLRAVATYLGARGRLHHFRIHAFDETGLIGVAEHTRAVVLPRRLLAGARRRAGRPAMLLDV